MTHAALEFARGTFAACSDEHNWYEHFQSDEVASILARAGARVIAPYTRGFGPTRFVSDAVMRSGQQAARGCDIVQLADALGLERPILGGFDWGGNASCVAAALWPERIGGLVSYAGYDVIDVSRQRYPVAPSLERVFWYQHLFQTERGRECLTDYLLPDCLDRVAAHRHSASLGKGRQT